MEPWRMSYEFFCDEIDQLIKEKISIATIERLDADIRSQRDGVFRDAIHHKAHRFLQ